MNATRVIALSSAVGAVIAATLFLTGCSPAATPTAGPSEAPTSAFQHIHELVPDASDGTLLIATHGNIGIFGPSQWFERAVTIISALARAVAGRIVPQHFFAPFQSRQAHMAHMPLRPR